jgi:hypothetical protein
MTREEELAAQQAFIDAGKSTKLKPFTSYHVAMMLQHQRRHWAHKRRPGTMLEVIHHAASTDPLDKPH